MARARRVAKRTKRASEPWVDDPQRRWRELTHQSEKSRGLEGLARKRRRGLEAARKLSPEETPLAPVRPGESTGSSSARRRSRAGRRTGRAGARDRPGDRHRPAPTDAKTIYVATSRGGVWKTTDGGVDLDAEVRQRAVARDRRARDREVRIPACSTPAPARATSSSTRTKFPLLDQREYNGAGILKTADGGNTWTLGGYTTFLGACFYRIAVDPTNANIAYAATNLGLYRTENGGTSWQQITSGLPAISSTVLSCSDVVVDPTNRNVVYAAFWADGVYKTTNAAAVSPTWTKLAGGFPTTDLTRISLALAPTATSNVYALVASRLGRAARASTDRRTAAAPGPRSTRGRRGRRRLRRVHVERRGRHLHAEHRLPLRASSLYKAVPHGRRPGP